MTYRATASYTDNDGRANHYTVPDRYASEGEAEASGAAYLDRIGIRGVVAVNEVSEASGGSPSGGASIRQRLGWYCSGCTPRRYRAPPVQRCPRCGGRKPWKNRALDRVLAWLMD